MNFCGGTDNTMENIYNEEIYIGFDLFTFKMYCTKILELKYENELDLWVVWGKKYKNFCEDNNYTYQEEL